MTDVRMGTLFAGVGGVMTATLAGDSMPLVVISARGTLMLNEAAYKALGFTHVVLLDWDYERQALSIRAVGSKSEGSFWIIRHYCQWPRPGIPSVPTYSVDTAEFFHLH